MTSAEANAAYDAYRERDGLGVDAEPNSQMRLAWCAGWENGAHLRKAIETDDIERATCEQR